MGLYKKALTFSSAGGATGLVAGSLLGAALAGQRHKGLGTLTGGLLGTLTGGYGVGALMEGAKSPSPPAPVEQTPEEMRAAENRAKVTRHRQKGDPKVRTFGEHWQDAKGTAKVLWDAWQDRVVQPAVDYEYEHAPEQLDKVKKTTGEAIDTLSLLFNALGKNINAAGRSGYRNFKKWHNEQEAERQRILNGDR